MTKQKKLTVSKLDAARRQLETVIRLYFAHADSVSIHTLTSAAYNVIRDVNRKRGGETLFAKDGFLERVKPGYEKEVQQRINAAENFFKHADRDHDDTLDFNPSQTDFLILEGCSTYYKLTGEFPPLFKVFQSWYVAANPDLFRFPESEQRSIAERAPEMVALGRERFFAEMLPIVMRLEA